MMGIRGGTIEIGPSLVENAAVILNPEIFCLQITDFAVLKKTSVVFISLLKKIMGILINC